MANPLSELFVRISADMSGLDKDMKKAVGIVRGFGFDLQDAGRTLTLGITAPLVGLGTAAVVSSSRFETAMAGVAKTLDDTGLSADEADAFVRELGEGFKRMSEEIPLSARELAKIGEIAGQLGVARGDILEFTRVIAAMGVSTNLSVEEAATSMARFAGIVGLPISRIEELGNVIVLLGNRLKTTESEITELGLRLAASGKQAGLTHGEILGFAAALSSVGIQAEAGGSAFSKVFTRIHDAVLNGGKQLEIFAAVAGVTAAEFKQAYETDAAGAIRIFIEGLGGMMERGESTTKVMQGLQLADDRLKRAVLSLAGAGGELKTSLDLQNQALVEGNALSEEANRFYGTSSNQLQILRNALENAAIELGDELIPALKDLVPLAESMIEKLSGMVRWFSELSTPMQRAIIGVLGLFAAIGPSLWMLGAMARGLGDIMKILGRGAFVKAATDATTATTGLGTAAKTTGAAFLGVLAPLAAIGIGFMQLKRIADGTAGTLETVLGLLANPLWAGAGMGLKSVRDNAGRAMEQGHDIPGWVPDFFLPKKNETGGGLAEVIGQITQRARDAAPVIGAYREANERLAVTEEETRLATEALDRALAGAGGSAKKTTSDLQQLINGLQEQAATAGLSKEEILLYQLEILKADEGTKTLALSLQASAISAEAKAEAMRKASEAVQAHRDRVNEIIKSLGEEYRGLTMTAAELLTYELRQHNATEADIAAALAKQEQIQAIETQIRVSEEMGRVWQEQLDAMNAANEKMKESTLSVMNELSGGFFGRMKDSWTSLRDVVEKMLGPAAGGAMQKVSGFASGLLAMAGPAGMAFQAIDAIGNLFGINLSDIISKTLGKAWNAVKGFFKDMLGLGGPSTSYKKAEQKLKDLPKEWQEAFKQVEEFGDLSKLGQGEDWRAIAEIAQTLHERGKSVQDFLDFFGVTPEDMRDIWDDLDDFVNQPGAGGAATNTAISTAARTSGNLVIPLYIDGREIARATAPHMVDEARMKGAIRNA